MYDKKQKLIDTLGFSDKKAQIYLAMLEAGDTNVIELAKRTGLKRTTIYNILPELLSEGYIKTAKQNKKHYYYIENVKQLERFAEEKLKVIQDLVPILNTKHNILSVKPNISLYEGKNGMRQLYQSILDHANPGDCILTYLGLHDFEEFVSEDVLDMYVSQRIKKKIINRVIITEHVTLKDWDDSISKLREVKIIKQSNLFSADMKIFGNRIAFLSYKENYFGVVLESKEVATLLKSMFQSLWDLLPKVEIKQFY